jgi:hypothetical protein
VEKKPRRTLIAVGVVGSFVAFVGSVVFMARSEIVTFEMAKLMLAALFGLYVGFGFLIFMYLLVRKMD